MTSSGYEVLAIRYGTRQASAADASLATGSWQAGALATGGYPGGARDQTTR